MIQTCACLPGMMPHTVSNCVEGNHQGHLHHFDDGCEQPAPDRVVQVQMDDIVVPEVREQEGQKGQEPREVEEIGREEGRQMEPGAPDVGRTEKCKSSPASRNIGRDDGLRYPGFIESPGKLPDLILHAANRIVGDRPNTVAKKMRREPQHSDRPVHGLAALIRRAEHQRHSTGMDGKLE